jgi:ABC-type bacteriocin/lantibiotic exporter with double-glycine peptidase domain
MSQLNVLRPVDRFRQLLQVDKKDLTQVYVYALFNGLVNLSLPLGIQAIINLIQGGEVSSSWIILVTFVIIGIALTGLLQLMQLRIVENIAQKIFSRASFEFAYRIPRIQYKELYNYYAPELANRFFDTLTIQKGLPKILIDFSLAAFQIIAGLVVLSMYHSFFIIFGVFLVALVYTILVFLGPKGIKTSLEESKYKYGVAHWLEEIARTKLSFKLICEPEISLENTNENVVKYLKAREQHFRVLVSQFFYLIGFKVTIAAGLLIIGSLLVFRQEMNIGQFVAAEIIILLIISSVEKLIQSLESIYDVMTALEKIGYVTDMELDNESGYSIEEDSDGLSTGFQNVSFSYPNSRKLIVENVNLHLPAGKSLCIMGKSGSGKSTLIALWSGIFEPTEGVINFNGHSLRSLNMGSLQRHIGFSLSNNQIFMGSFLDNITMGRPHVTLSQVEYAIEMLNLSQFSVSLPDGLDTHIDPEGRKIPRSIANKILLARAIVDEPKLLMLEDPLDHVEVSEKNELVRRLTDKQTPWSIIITTIDPIWNKYIPDKIVMDQGKIIENTLLKS